MNYTCNLSHTRKAGHSLKPVRLVYFHEVARFASVYCMLSSAQLNEILPHLSGDLIHIHSILVWHNIMGKSFGVLSVLNVVIDHYIP